MEKRQQSSPKFRLEGVVYGDGSLEGDTLHVQFQLRVTEEPDTLNNGLRQVLMRSLGERRMPLLPGCRPAHGLRP